MRRPVLLALGLVLFLAASAPAWERTITNSGHPNFKQVRLERTTAIEFQGWYTIVQGDLDVDRLVSDLEYDAEIEAKYRPGIRVSYGITPKDNVTLGYHGFEHAGRLRLPVTFHNRQYSPGAEMTLQNHWLDVSWSHLLGTWDAKQQRRAGFIDGIFGLRVVDAALDVAGSEPVTGAHVSGTWNQKFPIPFLGLGGGAQIGDRFWISGHLTYLSVNLGSGKTRTSDGDVNVAVRLNPDRQRVEWFGTLGYKNFQIEGELEGDHYEVTLKGPTFGFLTRF